MKFNLVLNTHDYAGDHVDDLRDQIENAGHEFSMTRVEVKQKPWFNLFFEGSAVMPLGRIKTFTNHKFIVIVTEEPTIVGNKLVWNKGMSDSTQPNFIARAEQFMTLVPHVDAAWCYAQGSATTMKNIIPASAEIELMMGKRFNRELPVTNPNFDFCFFGLLSSHREAMIAHVRKQGFTVDVIPIQSSLAQRDARIPNSRVVLDLKQFEWWELASAARYIAALYMGRPVIAEWRKGIAKDRWDKFVHFAGEFDFIEQAKIVLENWQSEYKRQFANLKNQKSMIEDAIKILPQEIQG